MKKLILFVVYLCAAQPVFADDLANTVTFYNAPAPKHSLVFQDDGTLVLDGVPMDRYSDPELKAIFAEFVAEMKRTNQENIMSNYLFRQTDYLLEELQKCQDRRSAQ